MNELTEVIRTELIRQMDEQGGYYTDIPQVNPKGLAIDGVIYFEPLINAIVKHLREDQRDE